jgi:hypothetical protein
MAMETIEIKLDEQTLERARQLAASRGVSLDELVGELVSHAAPNGGTAKVAVPRFLPRKGVRLLEKINEGLSPETWQRYHELKARRDAATLTPEEHAELIALSDTIEAWNVRRLEFVAELARLRGVPFPLLVRQLGLVPAGDA